MVGTAERWREFPALERVPSGVALTFDDGPDPDSTPAVLDALDAAGVRATFFVVGEQLMRLHALARDAGGVGASGLMPGGCRGGGSAKRPGSGGRCRSGRRARRELTAGGVDVAAAGEAHGRPHAALLQGVLEGVDRPAARPLEARL